ncbi:MAG: Ig-like domain-containing protein [Cystobacter sp.]
MAPVNVRMMECVTAGESISGSRILRASAEDNSGTVARVEFLVSGASACVDDSSRRSGSTFSCTWDASSTAPGSHQLTVRAEDAAGNSALSEPITFTVLAPNRAPVLRPVTATRTTLDEGSPVTVSVEATDPDGDALTYAWSQSPFSPVGSFVEGNRAQLTWTAPLLSSDTTFQLKVSVSDGKGGVTQGTVAVKVVNVPALNQAPSVEDEIQLEPAGIVAGKHVPLFIGARDADGDALTYAWKTTPPGGGFFPHASQASAEWRSGELSQPASYTLEVTVSDGTASVTRSRTVAVGIPTYRRDIEPLWSPTCSECHNAYSHEGLNLQVGASYGSLMEPGTGNCASGPRVIAGRPDDSLLFMRIGSVQQGCGPRMPLGDSDHFDQNPGALTEIRSWILAGALDN